MTVINVATFKVHVCQECEVEEASMEIKCKTNTLWLCHRCYPKFKEMLA